MNVVSKPSIAVVITLAMMVGVSSSLVAEVFTFGSDNEGLAGFTTSSTNATESWSLETNSVRYINDDIGTIDDGQDGNHENGAFLGEIVLDRSVGKSYTMEGVVTLTDGYADDNNRVGIYLFSDQADLRGPGGPVPSDEEAGALYLKYNTDAGRNQVAINEGLDGPTLAIEIKDAGLIGDSLFGTDLTFEAVIDFVEVGGTNLIDVTYTMTDATNDMTTISTTVVAADFTGDYFGFATRARCRGVTSLDRVEPWTMDYRSFSVTRPPESIGTILYVR